MNSTFPTSRMQDKSAAVIVAAGVSRRMKGRDKLWTPLSGRMVLSRTVSVFQASSLINTIILVISAERLSEAMALCRNERWYKVAAVVPGGIHRQDSVRHGLDALAEISPTCRWVTIHDGARPFVTPTNLEDGLKAAMEHQAVTAAVPVKDTIKEVQQGIIASTLERTRLWMVQTPQVFSFPLIYQAHQLMRQSGHDQEDITDDATLLTRLGHQVNIFLGSYTNIKITTQEDLLLAEALLQGFAAP
ncbi:2-C-methyl-D-erythritol 4-phosphate cytidylyltransferase [Ktedonosporobacter rubrisoli]|uniref:2-C-methyl-D-erythritol 4-phosphate cytidylyltransferase n=1 Tax=Ktedonosporobacter rubrisoli TaxID=2509675 RepID=A0A4P6K1D7_KTERU|nr:2-C-methyl-D-erythritol 4-phosphate cytidylyltransferase [Ktedonosporobacter rubrisoli]QBD81977.1 2-C-methyl-D-erythritol 4-phosphate cytidylyltransferase [Ktedonosporobacter rubrisoli]